MRTCQKITLRFGDSKTIRLHTKILSSRLKKKVFHLTVPLSKSFWKLKKTAVIAHFSVFNRP